MRQLLQLLVLLPLVAGGTACSGGLGWRSVAAMEGKLEIPHGTTAIRMELANGTAKILADPAAVLGYHGWLRRAGNTAELLAMVEQVPVAFTAAPDPDKPEVLVVHGPALPAGIEAGTAIVAFDDVTFRMPRELALTVNVAGSGHLTVEDRAAGVNLSTPHGDLRVMRCAGPTRIHTGSGNTIVYDHSGDLDVDVMLGDMQVFLRQPGTRLRLVTNDGNIQCFVPSDCGFRLDGRTETGKLANGFGIPIEKTGYSAAMVGSHGDGRTEIALRTGHGMLSLSDRQLAR